MRPFLSPRVDLLQGSGAVVTLSAPQTLEGWRRPLVLLAREVCSFNHFVAAGLTVRAAEKAARLHAQHAAPYLRAGSSVRRTPFGWAVWWWDLDRVEPSLTAAYGAAAAADVVPETWAQPPGEGWRIAKTQSGYEAQLWVGGALVASTWRARPFDAASWGAFARVQKAEGAPPPSRPPAPQVLPLRADLAAAGSRSLGLSRTGLIRAGAAAAALVAVGATGVLVGQGLRLDGEARRLRAEAQAISASVRPGAVRSDREKAERAAELSRAAGETNPLAAAGVALSIAELYGQTPRRVEIEDGRARVVLPYAALGAGDKLLAEFEGSGYFTEVTPRSDAAAGSLVFEMNVNRSVPAISPGA